MLKKLLTLSLAAVCSMLLANTAVSAEQENPATEIDGVISVECGLETPGYYFSEEDSASLMGEESILDKANNRAAMEKVKGIILDALIERKDVIEFDINDPELAFILENSEDIESFKAEISNMYFKLLDAHPEFFYVKDTKDFSYQISYLGNEYYFSQLYILYRMSPEETAEAKVIFDEKTKKIAQYASGDDHSDFEKALILHDYLVLNCQYDTSLEIHDAYTMLTEGIGVCESYTKLYKYLLELCGIKSVYSQSEEMQHIWNLVELDGKWYHVDVTWDDPTASDFLLNEDGTIVMRDSQTPVYKLDVLQDSDGNLLFHESGNPIFKDSVFIDENGELKMIDENGNTVEAPLTKNDILFYSNGTPVTFNNDGKTPVFKFEVVFDDNGNLKLNQDGSLIFKSRTRPGYPGFVTHDYFLIGDDDFKDSNLYNGNHHYSYISAADVSEESYEGAFWGVFAEENNDGFLYSDSPIVFDKENYYFNAYDITERKSAVIARSKATGEEKIVVSFDDYWYVPGTNTFYLGNYSGLALIDGVLIYNTPEEIRYVLPNGMHDTLIKKIQRKGGASGYIYRFGATLDGNLDKQDEPYYTHIEVPEKDHNSGWFDKKDRYRVEIDYFILRSSNDDTVNEIDIDVHVDFTDIHHYTNGKEAGQNGSALEAIIYKKPTYLTKGKKHRVCSVCGVVEPDTEEEVPAKHTQGDKAHDNPTIEDLHNVIKGIMGIGQGIFSPDNNDEFISNIDIDGDSKASLHDINDLFKYFREQYKSEKKAK